MLLQGFPCDQSQSQAHSQVPSQVPLQPSATAAAAASLSLPPASRSLPAGLFASPPASPPQLSPAPNALGNLFTTCRNLQAALLSAAPAPSGSPSLFPPTPPKPQHPEQLTPPLSYAPSPPMKLRLRSRKAAATTAGTNPSDASTAAPCVRKRIVKRTQPPRGPNKRRRAVDEGAEDSEVGQADQAATNIPVAVPSQPALAPPAELAGLAPAPALLPAAAVVSTPFQTVLPRGEHGEDEDAADARPQTPKRARIAPESLPLGLARADFHTLHADGIPDDASSHPNNADVEVEADGELWSTEEDRMLVELVLEKLQLSKTDWQDCARSLGKKDRHSVGRRWKSLMLSGDIGLRPGARSNRRGRIHGTWR